MGTYDVKFHAYEQAIKKDPAWAKMTKQQRAEQLGRYSVGLQRDAEKAAKKAAGKQLAKELAAERKDKIKLYTDLFDQMDARNQKQKMYEELWEQLDKKPKYNLVTDKFSITADKVDDMLGIGKDKNPVLDGMNDYYRFLEERSDIKRGIGKVLKDKPKITADKIDDMLGIGKKNEVLEAMGDYYKTLEQKGGNKFLDFLKNNKKTLLIGAGIIAAVGVGTWLWNKFNTDEAENAKTKDQTGNVVDAKSDSTNVASVIPGVVTNENDSTKVQVIPGVVTNENDSTNVKSDAQNGTVKESDKTKDKESVNNDNKANKKDKVVSEQVINTPSGQYEVKKGDNIWNIAKAQLADELGRRPYNREICQRRDEIMALNPNLKYEADNYTVLIYPKQTIKIAS